jgi:hypothetical protein
MMIKYELGDGQVIRDASRENIGGVKFGHVGMLLGSILGSL